MGTLPSGLADLVTDEEDLARFLTSSSQFKSLVVKPSALLPSPKDRETSVFRHGAEPRESLWRLGREHAARDRNLHGVAIFKARHVRAVELEVTATEPPPRHASIVGWPWTDDPDLQKAAQKELAARIAQQAELLRPGKA
jgi:hypothetical protein